MELRNLKSFVKVAQLGSITKAAENLGYSQSTVTIQIKNIEEELNVRLFDRIGKRIFLTHRGSQFLQDAKQIIDDLNAAIERVDQSNEVIKGTLRIGSISSIESSILSQIITEYFSKYPEVKIIVRAGTTEELLNLLKNGELDIICTLDHLVFEEEWVKEVNIKEPIVCLGSHQIESVSDKELKDYELFLTEKGESYRRLLEETLAKRNIQISPKIEAGSTELILKLIKNSAGITFVPKYCYDFNEARADLNIVSTDLGPMSLNLQLIRHKHKTKSLIVEYFIEIFRTWFLNRNKKLKI